MAEQQQKTYNYEIDAQELKTVFSNVLGSIGGKNLVVDNSERVQTVVKMLTEGQTVTGCKFYKNSLNNDKTVDESHSTVVISSFLNLKYLGLDRQNSKRVVLSHQMKDTLKDYFGSLTMDKYDNTQTKVLVFKELDGSVPEFVKNNKRNYVLLKVVMKFKN